MGKFQFIETGIKDLVIIEPTVFGDNRGYFMEIYSQNEFHEAGYFMKFVQDNQSFSKKGVLRGMHFQLKKPQGKLVRVIEGEVYDVALDIRKNSETFGKWFGVFISAENKKMFYVPEGFAHGFLVTSETAVFTYKCTNLYDPTDEVGIVWNDKEIGIQWPEIDTEYVISDKDKKQGSFSVVKNIL